MQVSELPSITHRRSIAVLVDRKLKFAVAYFATICLGVAGFVACQHVAKVWMPVLDPFADRVISSFIAFMIGFLVWSLLARRLRK